MKLENENETLERIARYLTQRFPEGVPTYLSLRETTSETSLYEDPFTPPNTGEESKKLFRPAPLDMKCTSSAKTYGVFPIPQGSSPRSSDLRNRLPLRSASPVLQPAVPLRAKPVVDKSRSPNLPPRSYPDPRVSKYCSESDSSDEDVEDEDTRNCYGNNFTCVIADLKKKFTTSNEAENLVKGPIVENEDAKGSDEWSDGGHKSLDRGFSYDDDSCDQSQREQALKDDLGEVCYSRKYARLVLRHLMVPI